MGEELDDRLSGGSRVQDDGATRGELLEHASRDASLDVGAALRAGRERGLDLEPLDGNRAAVDAAHGAAALERGEVPANRLGGDGQGIGQRGDLDAARGARLGEDALLSLRRVHLVTPLSGSGGRIPT
ncbi:hypothetical protein GCM10025873_16610 [Demequina sediminis]|nr:hypothetical protein GCM10025873_16610 [Demequina sediminis]